MVSRDDFDTFFKIPLRPVDSVAQNGALIKPSFCHFPAVSVPYEINVEAGWCENKQTL